MHHCLHDSVGADVDVLALLRAGPSGFDRQVVDLGESIEKAISKLFLWDWPPEWFEHVAFHPLLDPERRTGEFEGARMGGENVVTTRPKNTIDFAECSGTIHSSWNLRPAVEREQGIIKGLVVIAQVRRITNLILNLQPLLRGNTPRGVNHCRRNINSYDIIALLVQGDGCPARPATKVEYAAARLEVCLDDERFTRPQTPLRLLLVDCLRQG